MAYKRKDNRLPPFVPLTWQMLNSSAYKDLKPSAAKALPFFIGKVQGFNFRDPERFKADFTFSYTEARRYGLSRGTFYGIMCDLVEKGFLDPVERGGLRGYGLSFSKFRLSERWKRWGRFDFVKRDWKQTIPKSSPILALE